MSHTSDIESRSNHDGLQEIRAWASRSPQSVRPGFRARSQPGGFRYSPRLATSIGFALLLLLALTGYRSLQDEQGPTIHLAPAPPPEQVAASAPVTAEKKEPPPVEAVADSPPPPLEPVPAPATLPAPPVPEERPRKEEPEAAPAIVVSRDAFESEPAVLLAEPTADYPEVARGTGTSARVIVGFTIDETGTVRNPIIESIRIQGDAPKAPFEEAALAAARRAQFVPARERGVPARSWNTLTFLFETGVPPAGI